MIRDWRTTEDWWVHTWRWPWDPRWSANPLPPNVVGVGPARTDVRQTVGATVSVRPADEWMAVCQASCPWRGGPPQACGQGACCPRLCRGCEAGWPYDQDAKHIGPVKYPHSNRWECNRVKWLGLRGTIPCGVGLVEWVNETGASVLWENNSGFTVGWTDHNPVAPAVMLKVA